MNNPFTVFGLIPGPSLRAPSGAQVSLTQLKKMYLALQAVCHPDSFGSSSEVLQAVAEQKSAQASSAYKILTNDLARVKAWFKIQGFEVENQTMNTDFEMFELQMELSEALDAVKEDQTGAMSLRARLESIQSDAIIWFDSNSHKESFDIQNQASLAAYSKLAMATRLLQKLKDTLLT